MINDCRSCNRPCGYESVEYFAQSAIDNHYCRVQIVWAIRNLATTEGWPVKQTGYVDTHEDVQTSAPQDAPHRGAIETWAEISYRITKAGEDGETLVSEAINIENPNNFSRAARNALNFVSGFRRRRLSYSKWLYEQKRKHK
jgi:hypothetical protein